MIRFNHLAQALAYMRHPANSGVAVMCSVPQKEDEVCFFEQEVLDYFRGVPGQPKLLGEVIEELQVLERALGPHALVSVAGAYASGGDVLGVEQHGGQVVLLSDIMSG